MPRATRWRPRRRRAAALVDAGRGQGRQRVLRERGLPHLVDVEPVELGRVEVAHLRAARVHHDDGRLGEGLAQVLLEARVRLVRVRDEEAVADPPDPGGEDLVVAAAQVLHDLDLAEEPLGQGAVVRGGALRLELLDRRHRLERQRHVDEAAVEHARGLERAGQPDRERGAGLDDAVVAERLAGRQHALERRERTEAEPAPVLVGDGRVADVLMGGAELARGALEEEARGAAGVLLDDLAHGADVVGGDQRVLPGERRRVAGVVDDRAEHAPVVGRGDPPDDERVVGTARRG